MSKKSDQELRENLSAALELFTRVRGRYIEIEPGFYIDVNDIRGVRIVKTMLPSDEQVYRVVALLSENHCHEIADYDTIDEAREIALMIVDKCGGLIPWIPEA